MRAFHCIVDAGEVPDETRDRLRSACLARGLSYLEHDAQRLDPLAPPLPEGSLLYAAGTTLAARRAECALWQPGVATFHRGPLGPLERVLAQDVAFSRAGLATPRSVRLPLVTPALLERVVAHVGGLPVVLKVDGGENGVGVVKLDSFETLLATTQLLLAQGIAPRVMAYVPDAMHWRVVVLGDAVLTAYRNPRKARDFRSTPSSEPRDYGVAPPPEVAELAIGAAQVARTYFAGVDVLVHPSGRAYLLEANVPCYFAQATDVAGIDVAGPMVDFLLAQAD